MPKIVVTAETEYWVTRPPRSDDPWDKGDSQGRVANVLAYIDTRPDAFYYGESMAKELGVQPGDTVYAVVADYETGDTFGRSGGHAQVVDAFADLERAKGLLRAAREGTGYTFTFEGREYSRLWVGFFERLNELAVWAVPVRKHRSDPFRSEPDEMDRITIRYGH